MRRQTLMPESMPRRRLLRGVGASLVTGWAAPLSAQSQPLRLGLAPFLSATAMLALFRPVREHLERHLGRNVTSFSARDFRSLAQSAQRHEYDLALLPAHLARLATLDWGYMALAGTLGTSRVQLLVRKDSTLQKLSDLKGARLGALDPLSMVAAATFNWLRNQGLHNERDYRLLAQASVNSALYALEHGDVDVITVAASQLATLPKDTPRVDRVLGEVTDIVGPIYVARTDLPAAEVARLREALLAFAPDAAAPTTVANTALRAVGTAELGSLDAHAAEARRVLSRP